jgi:plasmid maintenance system antidote protein VapI
VTSQISLPASVRPDEVERQKSLGDAIALCANVGGFSLDKTLQMELGVDKAQFSRWQSGGEGVTWPKFERLMDVCGNDAPLLWMLYQRGYDLHSLRKRETETEQALREAREQLAVERAERQAIESAMRRMLVGTTS